MKKYFSQLRNLGQILRDLTMDSITKFVSVEKDAAYMMAQEKEQTRFVSYLLNETNHSVEQVAAIAGVSAEFVTGIQQKLIKDQ